MAQFDDWYGRDWRILRKELVKLCVNCAGAFLEDVRNSPNQLIELLEEFKQSVMAEISGLATIDQTGLWPAAMALLVDDGSLDVALKKDLKAIEGGAVRRGNKVSAGQALGQVLRSHFEEARRKLLAADMGTSPSMVKTWERLDRISREITRDRPGVRRCSEEHFNELAGAVKERFPNDKNLPRKISTIQQYFFRFSDECVESVDDISEIHGHWSPEDVRGVFGEFAYEILIECLEAQSPEDAMLVDATFGLGIFDRESNNVVMMHSNYQDTANERSLVSVLASLRQCLESNIESRYLGDYS